MLQERQDKPALPVQAESKVPPELLGKLELQGPRGLRGLKDHKASQVQPEPQVRQVPLEQLDKPASLERRGQQVRLALLVPWERQELPESLVHKALAAHKEPREPPDKLVRQVLLVSQVPKANRA